jgi:hypothetical protein
LATSDEHIHSELIDELDRIREKRISESKKNETDEAVTRKDDLPPKRSPKSSLAALSFLPCLRKVPSKMSCRALFHFA